MVLQKMRAGAQGVFAKVLVGLIVFVLAVFGFGAIDLFSASEPVAATVNGDDITQRLLELETARQRTYQRSRFGDIPDELIDRLVTQEGVLEALIDQTLLGQAATDLDLSVDDQVVNQRIRRDFGATDEATYRNLLANQGYTPTSFEEEMAESEIRGQLTNGFLDTAFATTREVRHAAQMQTQRRDIAWLLFDIDQLAEDVGVTDAEIADHYANHIDDYMTEERFDFDFVRLPRRGLADDMEIDEEAVVAAYEEETAALEPRRHGAHILLEVNDERSVEDATRQLAEARAEIEAGADFAAKAKELSEDAGSAPSGGDLGAAGKGVFVPAFEEALWALAPGQMSDPVETEFGVHLIQLIAIEEPEIPPLEERRDEIVADLRSGEEQRLFDEIVREMEEIAFESDSLAAITTEYGLTVEQIDGATRASADGVLADANVREALFGDDVLLEGYNSAAVVTADSEAVVGRLRSRHPAVERPLDEVRDDVRAAIAREAARDLATRHAFDALANLAAGETPADVAAQSGSEWQRADGLLIDGGDVPPAIAKLAFEMTAPTADRRTNEVATLANGSRAVVVLSNVVLGDYDAMTESDRTALAESSERLAANRDYAALLATLRTDASISAIDFDDAAP